MEIGIKHVLLFISIIVFIGVFYRVISSRLYHVTQVVEGMDNASQQSCDNNYGDKEGLPLKEYIIKACSNSAYDPNYAEQINATILETRIAEGYRFLDLNVFSSEGKLYVGYSPDNKPTLTSISIPFAEAIDCIKKHAFVKSSMKLDEGIPLLEGTPTIGPSIHDNYVEYPMFVLIRVYRSEKSKLDIIEKLMDHLQTTADAKYYRNGHGDTETAIEIDGCTPLSHIKGKIIFVVDIVNLLQIYTPIETPTADQIPEATRKHLKRFVNIYTGGNIWRHAILSKSAPLRISDLNQPYKTNLFNMQILFPSPQETSNPDAQNAIMEHSIQTVVVRPYLADTNLRAYTQIFKDLKRPMICGAYVHNYIKKLEK